MHSTSGVRGRPTAPQRCSREGEQLRVELAPLRAASSASSPCAQRARSGDGVCDQVEVADDGGQQVVEVVRDAAGELADRLHLLRLTQHVFRASSLRHVAHHEYDE